MLELLRRLTEAGVDYGLVGGMAAAAHGSPLVTQDVGIRFDLETVRRVLDALVEVNPRQRMTPTSRSCPRIRRPTSGGGTCVITDLGQLDFLGQVTGLGEYDEVVAGAVWLDLGGFSCQVLGLEALIQAKRALGRPKDLRAAAELELARRSRS